MRKLAVFALILVAGAAACARPLAPPPALFPMKQAWRVPLGDAVETPMASDGRLLFVALRGEEVLALSLVDGAVAWREPLQGRRLAAAAGALVTRDEDGVALGVDPDSGRERWKASTGVRGTLPPVLDGGTVFVAGAGVAALEAATGRLVWAIDDGGVASAPPTPSPERLFVSEAEGVLRCRDRASGESLWTFDTGAPAPSAASLAPGGALFLGSGRAVESVRRDGSGRRWRWRLGADAPLAPVVRDGSVLVAAYDATLYALNASNGHLNWRAPLPSRPISAPLVSGVTVLVACLDNQVAGFDARNGRSLGSLRTPVAMTGPPVLVADRLYAALQDRSVAAFSLSLAPGAAPEPPAGKKGGRRRQAKP